MYGTTLDPQSAYASVVAVGAAVYVALSCVFPSPETLPTALRLFAPVAIVVAARREAWTRGWRLPSYDERGAGAVDATRSEAAAIDTRAKKKDGVVAAGPASPWSWPSSGGRGAR